MEKTLSLGAFTELDENEVMEVDGGGILGGIIVFGVIVIGVTVAIDVVCNAVNNGNKRLVDEGKQSQCNLIGPSAYYSAYSNGWRPTDDQPLPVYTGE
jgi:lactobin A/cerein 7B family class IIb bacteriocin